MPSRWGFRVASHYFAQEAPISNELALARRNVGLAVRSHRQSAGLSLSELAKMVDVATSTLSKIETGKISVSFERLDHIARALGISVSELIGAEPATPPQSSAGPVNLISPIGVRRSVSLEKDGFEVDAGQYVHLFKSTDLLFKQMQPLISEITCDSLDEYGALSRHDGEEFNYVIQGQLIFFTDVYAPVTLGTGDSVYFDAEIGHAHIRVGNAPCKILAVISPRASTNASGGVPDLSKMMREGSFNFHESNGHGLTVKKKKTGTLK